MKFIAECGMRIADCNSKGMKPQALNPKSEIRNPQSKGFTLLEVMIAVAILAMVLVSLLGLKNRSMQDVMKAERITTSTLLAKRLMTDALMIKQQVAEEEGVFPEEVYGDVYKDYRWKKTVTATSIPNVLEVQIAVLWKEGARDEMVELVSYE